MDAYENTRLWKSNLASQGNDDEYSKAREILRVAFQQVRESVAPLVAQISKELPGLTVHDISHLDALWDVADTLLGDDYDINPAETFVLGMTFLLHDAATSTFSFHGGVESLRETDEWRDFVSQNKLTEDDLIRGAQGYRDALFETLRMLHPRQAAKLLKQSWTDINGEQKWLMENIDLRNHYGDAIGEIAASHGEDIASIEQKWSNAAPLTPPAGPVFWKVDRLKVALLLRCIDASHIDSRRAPSMLAALVGPSGASKSHWQFQNKIGCISLDNNKEVYWTSPAFSEDQADSWWLFYDVAKMIDREIRSSNRILLDNARKSMAALGVLGANNLNLFEKNVPTQNWRPFDINFGISRVSDVIEKFGGSKLYGNEPYLALRELMQNATDAISAINAIKAGSPTKGRIEVSIVDRDDEVWLHVLDNGIGMSRYVMTDILLDFGRSLWKHSDMREQWPGLAATKFESIGQFGIGFFSIFMLGDVVKVTSWRYRDAGADQNTLLLRDRMVSRPLLIKTPMDERLNDFGTRVSVRLKSGRDKLLKKVKVGGLSHVFETDAEDRRLSLREVVGILAPASEYDIFCSDGDDNLTECVRANDWQSISSIDLLRRLAPGYSEEELASRSTSLVDIKASDGSIVGRFGIFGSGFGGFGYDLGALTFKGLHSARGQFSGVLVSSNNSDLSRSAAVPICTAESLVTSANSLVANLNQQAYPHLTSKLLSLGASLGNLPVAYINNSPVNHKEILKFMDHRESFIFLNDNIDCPDEIPKDEFDSNFSIGGDVISIHSLHMPRHDFGLDSWLSNLLPENKDHFRSIGAALNSIIREAWPNAIFVKASCVVGSVDGRSVTNDCVMVMRS